MKVTFRHKQKQFKLCREEGHPVKGAKNPPLSFKVTIVSNPAIC